MSNREQQLVLTILALRSKNFWVNWGDDVFLAKIVADNDRSVLIEYVEPDGSEDEGPVQESISLDSSMHSSTD